MAGGRAPETYDLVICGAGAAGMPCAIAAAEEGARVVVIEKAAEVGGTLHVAGGHLSGAGTRRQAEQGIDDRPEWHYDDVMRISGDSADPDLVRLAVTEAGPTLDWLDELGFPHDPRSPQPALLFKPYGVSRLYWGDSADSQKGPVILRTIRPAWDRLVAAGRIELLLEHRLVEVIVAQGAAAGVRAEGPDGARVELRGRDVVLATGGYASNPALFAELTPGAPDVLGLARPAATGDGIQAARALGATVRSADRFLLNYGVLEATPGSERGAAREGIDLRLERARREIWVNAAGERFVAEDVQSLVAQHRALRGQPGQRVWLVLDDAALRDGPAVHVKWDGPELRRRAAERRHAWSADTIGALARLAGIDPQGLERTVAAWNAACAAGTDPLGRTTGLVPLAEPPFLAVLMRVGATISFGGLAVDGELRVLGADGEPIPGLYAAGEILGGALTSGQSYTGGMLLTPALAFGRLLGRRLGAARRGAPAP